MVPMFAALVEDVGQYFGNRERSPAVSDNSSVPVERHRAHTDPKFVYRLGSAQMLPACGPRCSHLARHVTRVAARPRSASLSRPLLSSRSRRPNSAACANIPPSCARPDGRGRNIPQQILAPLAKAKSSNLQFCKAGRRSWLQLPRSFHAFHFFFLLGVFLCADAKSPGELCLFLCKTHGRARRSACRHA